MGLEDEADLAIAEGGELQFIELGQVLVVEADLAAGWAVEGSDDVEQGTFAQPDGPMMAAD